LTAVVRATRSLGVPALALLLVTACGRSTTHLEGCVGTGTPAEQIVTGTVMFVPASPEFDRQWNDIVQSFQKDYRAARAAHEAAVRTYRGTQAAERSARAEDQRIMKSAPSERLTVRRDRQTGARIYSNQAPPGESYAAAQARAAASARIAAAEREMGAAISAHTNMAVELIKRNQTSAVRTDYKGCYAAKDAPRGKVYAFANLGDRYWFREAALGKGQGRIDFSANESAWPFRELPRQ
jgi:hypothetical protein